MPAQLQIRLRRTESGVAALRISILTWLAKRREADRDRHKTQLESIESVIAGSARALHDETLSLATILDAGEMYQRCRRVDEAAAWLQRVWQFYKERFDQRDDQSSPALAALDLAPGDPLKTASAAQLPALGQTVRAADEIVWSAYHSVMKLAAAPGGAIEHGPAPLPFAAAAYSPSAIDNSRPLSQDLRLYLEFPTFDPRLKKLISQLAVPLLVLPTWAVNAPWWLIFIAHEVGHHLTRRLGLLLHFATAIDRAVNQLTGLAADRETQWRAWTDEIVADAWSLALVGPVAAEALAEIEMSTASDVTSANKDARYPPVVIRLGLMKRVSELLGLGVPRLPAELLPAAPANGWPLISELAGHIDVVAGVLVGPLPGGLKSLKALTQIESPAQTNQLLREVDYWRDNVLGRPVAQAKNDRAARFIAAGIFKAWVRNGAGATVTTYEANNSALAAAAFDLFDAAGADGERAGLQPAGSQEPLAKELTDLLLRMSDEGAPEMTGATP